MGRKRPPRIRGFDYLGLHAYFLTICTQDRYRAFEDRVHAECVCTQILQSAGDYRFEIIAYVVMPDHAHALAEGTRDDANFVGFVSMLKQRSAYDYSRVCPRRLWQEGFFDHVLREEESKIGIASYIIHNPVRAGLCTSVLDYPFVGSQRYTIRELIDAVQIRPRRSRP